MAIEEGVGKALDDVAGERGALEIGIPLREYLHQEAETGMVGEHFHADDDADDGVTGKEAQQHRTQGLLMQGPMSRDHREQGGSGDDEGEHAAVGVVGGQRPARVDQQIDRRDGQHQRQAGGAEGAQIAHGRPKPEQGGEHAEQQDDRRALRHLPSQRRRVSLNSGMLVRLTHAEHLR